MRARTIYFQTLSTGNSNCAPRLVKRMHWRCLSCPRTYRCINGVNLHRRLKHDADEQIRLENIERRIVKKKDTIAKNDEKAVRWAIDKARKAIESRTMGRISVEIASEQVIS